MTKRGIVITRDVFLKGMRKVGLDSGMSISLIDNENLFSDYVLKIEDEEGLLFTHQICTEETVEVLSRDDYGWEKDKAEKAMKEFLKKYNIEVIPRDKGNSETLKWMFKKCKEANIEFHPPDCFIIADFHKNGINKIYSNNNHFLDACRLFGMETEKLRTSDNEIKKQMREIFKKRRK